MDRIICGDCLEAMKSIEDKSIDMILCDLPYGTTACKWDVVIPFEPLWKQYKRIVKDRVAIVLMASQPFTTMLIHSNIKMFKYEWIWDKKVSGSFHLAKIQPMKIHENVLVFGGGGIKYNPLMQDADVKKNRPQKVCGQIKGKEYTTSVARLSSGVYRYSDNRNNKKRYPKTILEYHARGAECNPIHRLHPTQKPVALFEYLIKTYTNEGDLVLDNCAGSGTTGVACKNLNRQFILIEKDPIYYEMARKRIDATPERLV